MASHSGSSYLAGLTTSHRPYSAPVARSPEPVLALQLANPFGELSMLFDQAAQRGYLSASRRSTGLTILFRSLEATGPQTEKLAGRKTAG